MHRATRSGVVVTLGLLLFGCSSQDPVDINPPEPPVVPEPVAWSMVIAGKLHSCGIAEGRVYCWGEGEDGRLGSGSEGSSAAPLPVVGDLTWRVLHVRAYHSCGVTTNGDAYCWGRGSDGQLGDGRESMSATPVLVSGGHEWTYVSAGAVHTCGLTTAGQAYCWGQGFYGQLGDGSLDGSTTPVPVAGGHTWVSIHAGAHHTCGVTDTAEAYCWGDNTSGEFGNGGPSSGSVIPVAVSGGLSWQLVSAGARHSCGLTTTGESYCWGADEEGQLGNDVEFAAAYTPTAVDDQLDLALIQAGILTSCAVSADGDGYCWGRGVEGQLGNGLPADRPTPTLVTGGLRWAQITGGEVHSCGVTTGGAAYCWGADDVGQLGNGVDGASAVPSPVAVPQP